MELKYKEPKIRDLFTHFTNIVPLKIDIQRHYIYITIENTHMLLENWEGIEQKLSSLTGRKVLVVFKK